MPIFIPVLAAIFLSEVTTRREWIGVIIAVFGVSLVFASKEISISSRFFLGNIWAILSAFFLAVYTVMGRRTGLKYSSLTTMTWVFGAGAIFIFVEGLMVGDPFLTSPDIEDLLSLIGLSVLGTILAHTAYIESLRVLRATTAIQLHLSHR